MDAVERGAPERRGLARAHVDGDARHSKAVGRRIEELAKPCVIVINKWDLAKGITTDQYAAYLCLSTPLPL